MSHGFAQRFVERLQQLPEFRDYKQKDPQYIYKKYPVTDDVATLGISVNARKDKGVFVRFQIGNRNNLSLHESNLKHHVKKVHDEEKWIPQKATLCLKWECDPQTENEEELLDWCLRTWRQFKFYVDSL